jgi:hypothetical protein
MTANHGTVARRGDVRQRTNRTQVGERRGVIDMVAHVGDSITIGVYVSAHYKCVEESGVDFVGGDRQFWKLATWIE